VKRLLFAIVLLFAFAPATPAVAGESSPPPGVPRDARHINALEIDEIYSLLNNKCMDADTNTIQFNGTKIQIWDCNRYLQQRWQLNWGRTSTYVNVFSGRCLEVNPNIANQNGAPLALWDCNGGNWQDWWYVDSDASLHNGRNGKCLDVDPAIANQNGTKLQLWDCNGGTQQKWRFHLYG